MIDLLVNLCSRTRLNPADHSIFIPSDSNPRYPMTYTASQSLHSLGVSTVHLVAKKHFERWRPSAEQLPFEVNNRIYFFKFMCVSFVNMIRAVCLFQVNFDILTDAQLQYRN
jgi:hypothetical protein